MKKILLITILFVTALAASAQDTISAYLSCDPPMAYILNKPRGATVMTLSYEKSYVFSLTSPQEGWWKIVEFWNAEDDEDTTVLEGSDTGEYWIHYTALGLGTRNYGGQEIFLRAEPDEDAAIVYTTNREIELMPMDVRGDWVKVMVDGQDIEGWIEAEWICSNPLTNCC
ncbi:MAG: hypothetical protein IJK93_08250 [Muribaculaceae bacterium]|nr:hypothetical protein [Muribaculaceae bacterium]